MPDPGVRTAQDPALLGPTEAGRLLIQNYLNTRANPTVPHARVPPPCTPTMHPYPHTRVPPPGTHHPARCVSVALHAQPAGLRSFTRLLIFLHIATSCVTDLAIDSSKDVTNSSEPVKPARIKCKEADRGARYGLQASPPQRAGPRTSSAGPTEGLATSQTGQEMAGGTALSGLNPLISVFSNPKTRKLTPFLARK